MAKEETVKDEDAEKSLKQTLETILDALEDYGANGTTAKVISEATKMDKSEVNRVLYLCLKRGMDLRLTHDSKKAPPTWALDVTKEKGSGGGAAAAKAAKEGVNVVGLGASKQKKRGALVSKLMKEQKMTLGQASKHIKENNLL